MFYRISHRYRLTRRCKNYIITEEEIEVALAFIKPEGFNKDEINGKIIYTSEIIYHKDKVDLLLKYEYFKESNIRTNI